MSKLLIRIAIFVLVSAFIPLEGEAITNFITEVFITGVLEGVKTLFNKHITYYS